MRTTVGSRDRSEIGTLVSLGHDYGPNLVTLRFHEIAESRHRILNPLSTDKLSLLGRICVGSGSPTILDLCCGKAEMLCTWAAEHGASGVGVDISDVFLAAARERVAELGVEEKVTLVHADAAQYVADAQAQFDIVSCIGATWIGNGLVGTLQLMRPRVKTDGLVVVGEPYWVDPLPVGLSVHIEGDDFVVLAETLDRFESAGFELVEMVLSSPDDWDRYFAAQWMTVDAWLTANPRDPDAAAVREWITAGRRSYLGVERRYLGWGVFVLRIRR